MDVLLSMTVLGGMVFFSILALFQMVNQRFPPVAIDVYDRGVKQRIKYRLAGTTIVESNIFQLLVNKFNICGDIRLLEFDMIQKKFLNIMPLGLARVYRAYRRHDYLFILKHIKHTTVKTKGVDGKEIIQEVMKQPPAIIVENKKGGAVINATFSKEGLLVPLNIALANEKLQEVEVSNGKAICARFIESDKSINQLTDASNPIITTLLMALPLLLVVIANGLVAYLILSGVSDDVLKITILQKEIADALIAIR